MSETQQESSVHVPTAQTSATRDEENDPRVEDDAVAPAHLPGENGESHRLPPVSGPRMPDLRPRRYATERPPPLTRRTTWLNRPRRATGGDMTVVSLVGKGTPYCDSPPSSAGASLNNETTSLRDWALPAHQQTHMAQLNRTEGPDRPHHHRPQPEPSHRTAHTQHGSRDDGQDGKSVQGEKDGRLSLSLNEILNFGHLARALGLKRHHHQAAQTAPSANDDAAKAEAKPHFPATDQSIPRMNIVIMVIGSRGDIQPFLKIGKILKEKHGHRVRIATHPVFREFVQRDSALEFFSVGGDPSELMSFMVKNPGLLPSFETVRAGEIGRRRESMYEMFQGFWHACVNAIDDQKDAANLKMMGERYPFIADAIIANPPSFAHIHCAERLGIPLHLVFTFPFTPTQHFPHPLANITADEADPSYTNLMSYPLIDLMTWQGLGDLVNHFRVKTLGLQPMSTLWAPGQLFRLKVPHTYLWSPGLVPKPSDWGPEIDVAGYVFLDLASTYQPSEEMTKFLAAGEAPIYIGFGSISGVDDPDAFAEMVFGAVEKAQVRAIISKGWGDMGKGREIPDRVLLVDNVPHDWLFPRVQAVVHHGGAGTTAIGLKCGRPTMIVPFFGDQPFWGAMIARAHAGAERCLSLSELDVDSFAAGIRQCLSPEARQNAQKIADRIAVEGDGADNMADSFHRALPLHGEHSLRCVVFPRRVAVWRYKRTGLHLSALAAYLLVEKACLQWRDLRLLRHYEWNDFQGPGEPISGAGGVVLSDVRDILAGLASIPPRTRRGLKMREKQRRRRQRRTVAHAVASPGQMAEERIRLSTSADPPAAEAGRSSVDEVNLRGSAAPPARRWRHVVVRSPTSGIDQPSAAAAAAAAVTTPARPDHYLPEPPPAAMIVLRAVLQGLGQSGKILVRMPFDFFYAFALGLHNAPRLYGDGTVRRPPCPITGFRSGLHSAGTELAYGVSDGVVGLARLPRREMHDVGLGLGMVAGLGKGVGGLVLKPAAGVVGLAGFTGRGIEVGLRNRVRDTAKTDRWLRRAQMHQGEKDFRTLADTHLKADDEHSATQHALELWSQHTRALSHDEQ